MDRTYKICIFLAYIVTAAAQASNCTTLERRTRQNKVEYAQIFCRHVPSNFVINDVYFVDKGYVQDLMIFESNIPVLSNYSSLLNMGPIRALTMKDQHVKHIQPGAFRNMENLEVLDLGYNELTDLPNGAFKGLTNLRRLLLTSNNISAEPDKVFEDLPNLEYLDIADNPLKDIKPEKFVKKVEVNVKSNQAP